MCDIGVRNVNLGVTTRTLSFSFFVFFSVLWLVMFPTLIEVLYYSFPVAVRKSKRAKLLLIFFFLFCRWCAKLVYVFASPFWFKSFTNGRFVTQTHTDSSSNYIHTALEFNVRNKLVTPLFICRRAHNMAAKLERKTSFNKEGKVAARQNPRTGCFIQARSHTLVSFRQHPINTNQQDRYGHNLKSKKQMYKINRTRSER